MTPEIEEVLSNFSYGLYILTVEADGWPMSMVASWVSQASYDPPLVMAAVRENRYACELIREKKAFALFVMGPEDVKLMNKFKNKDARERLADVTVTRGETGAPLIDAGLGYVECTLEDEVTLGDHTVFFGRIRGGKTLRRGQPATTGDYGKVYLGKG